MFEDGIRQEALVPGTGIKFTNNKDATSVCIPQYAEAFFARMSQLGIDGKLELTDLRWGDGDLQQLADAMVVAHAKGALAKLATLRLNNNKIGDQGLTSLADACAKGGLPQCTRIEVQSNPAGEEVRQAVHDAIKNRSMST